MWIFSSGITTAVQGSPGFLIEACRQGKAETYELADEPARANMSREPKLKGWCGETNNVTVNALGIWKPVKTSPNGQRTFLEEVTDHEELEAYLDMVGYPELLPAKPAEPKKRTVTLTGRPPVKIVESDWPIIAKAIGDNYQGLDEARHEQARNQGELDQFSLRVRRHADGRVLVYGTYETGWHPEAEAWRGGELLEAGADLPAAIRRVGEDGHIPDRVIRECIADLPAEEI